MHTTSKFKLISVTGVTGMAIAGALVAVDLYKSDSGEDMIIWQNTRFSLDPDDFVVETPTGNVRCSNIGVLNKDDCDAYTEVILNLLEAPLAYNRPDRMTLYEDVEVALTVDPRSDPDPKVDLGDIEDSIVEGTTKIARYMSAALYGNAFRVEPAEPQRRLITRAVPTRWRWTVTPHQAGDGKLLTLDLYVHIQDGDAILEPITVRTFRDRIFVDVTTWTRITNVVTELQPVHAFAVALFGSLSGLLAWLWQRSRSRPAGAAADPGAAGRSDRETREQPKPGEKGKDTVS